jgi:serine/threonine-protein kinase
VAALRAEGLRPVVHREFSDLAGEGLVARQAPAAGAAADDGERVDVWVSEGPVTIPAPDLVGKTSSAARDALEQAVLDGERHRQAHNSAAPGTVFKQVPAAGVTVARGDTVAYYISLGRPRVAVPDVIGLSAGDAQAALEELGLVAAVDLVAGWGDVPGSVVGQDPAPGERLRVGSEVVLSVAVF